MPVRVSLHLWKMFVFESEAEREPFFVLGIGVERTPRRERPLAWVVRSDVLHVGAGEHCSASMNDESSLANETFVDLTVDAQVERVTVGVWLLRLDSLHASKLREPAVSHTKESTGHVFVHEDLLRKNIGP